MNSSRWHEVEAFYHAALDCEPGERDLLLARADPDLRREVESLLNQTSRGSPIDRAAWEGAGSLLASTSMQLIPGKQLGPYKIEAAIGAGGMGQVFRAKDTRLGRLVAVKIVDPRFSARFEREAHAISALNHPHICTLHDVGPGYMVMELIEGDTLAARLKKGPLPLNHVLEYGAQIADALAAAHAQGVIHRDLKPGNIMLTKAGVKVLDFGLAKSSQDETLTASRAVMGTPAYMAPEQTAGGKCDARTDIYALGLVLSEMAAGKRGSLDQVPAQLAHIIERCLAQEPDERWQAISDVRAELRWAGTAQPAGRAPSVKPYWLWLLAGVCAVMAIAAAIWAIPKGRVAASPAQFPLMITEATGMPVISPNGRYLAFEGKDENGNRQLFTRALNAPRSRALAGTADSSAPIWSPDSQWVAFFAAGRLKKVRPEGGPVQTIANLPGFQGGSWGPKGDILFRPSNREPLYLLRGSGGAPVQVTRLDVSLNENSHRDPQFLPDGRRFLYLARSAKRQNNALYLGSIDSFHRTRVMQADANTLYLPPAHGGAGRLLYYKEGALVIQPFDADAVRLLDEPKVVAEQIAFNAPSALAFFSASLDGRWLLTRPPEAAYTHFEWFDRRGQLLETLPINGELIQPRLSPDGGRLAFERPDARDGNRDIWVAELTRGVVAPLTTDPANDWMQVWSPDGKQMLFDSDRNSSAKLATYLKKSMEPGAEEYPTPLPEGPYDWSSDGNWIALGTHDILVASAKDFHSFPYLATGFDEGGARFSPDTKWLAYSSDESGRTEVYIRPFKGAPAGPGEIQISTNGGDFPVWRRDGRELFFMSTDNFIYSVDLSSLASARAVPAAVKLFRACPQTAPSAAAGEKVPYQYTFDTRDGNRFIMSCRVSAPGQFAILVDAISK